MTATVLSSDVKVLVEIFNYDNLLNYLIDIGKIVICKIEIVIDDLYVIDCVDLGLFSIIRKYIRIINYNERH